MEQKILLEAIHLKKYFPVNKKRLRAVDDVSFCVRRGETLGIVGESGCGKTTCGKTCMGMLHVTGGQVLFDGQDVHRMNRREHYEFTKKVQMIFQDPYSSLDPKMKVYDIVAEGIRLHKIAADRADEAKRVRALLAAVGLNGEQGNRYIHEFSGGQRQRIGIARALAVDPELLVCDEPISALDVSIQAQIVNLLKEIQEDRSLAMLFIAHDLPMVRYIADRIAVMYLGKIVELADAEELCEYPAHPYTRALLSAIPVPEPGRAKAETEYILEGELPSAADEIEGCVFAGRCPYAESRCRREAPETVEIREGHYSACHRCKEWTRDEI